MAQKLFKRGERVGVVLPREVAERYHLAPGVEVEIELSDQGIVLKPIGVRPWFSIEWERALDFVVENHRGALEQAGG